MRVRFSPAAIADVERIRDYIAKDDAGAAERVVERIAQTVEFLRIFPGLGHIGVVPSAFEVVVPGLPYVVVYQVELGDEDEVVILRIYHGAQDRS